jgi:sugar lactone lactonase YvrE
MQNPWRDSTLLLIVLAIVWCPTPAHAQIQDGYTTLTPDSGSPAPAGAALFSYTNPDGVLVTQAGVGASALIQSGRILVDEAGSRTGIAMVNPSGEDASVAFSLRDDTGARIDGNSVPLGAHQHVALYVSDLFPNHSGGFTGTLTFDSNQPIAAITLRESRNVQGEPVYTTIPVLDLNAAAGTQAVVFPHIAVGGGFTTQILLMNGTSQPMLGRIDFVASDGKPLSVVSGTNVIVSLQYAIPAQGTYRTELDGVGGVSDGYALVTPASGSSAPAGTIVFRLKSGGNLVTEAGVAASLPTTAARIFVDYIGTKTGIAMANPADTPANVTLTLLDRFGFAQTPSIHQVLPPRSHIARFVDEIFSIGEGYTGLLEIQSDSPISSVALKLTINHRSDLVLTTLPVADLTRPAGNGLLVFPHIVIGGGFSTRLILINTSTTAVSAGLMTFYKSDGSPFVVPMTGQSGSQFRYSVAQGGGRQLYPGNSAAAVSIAVIDPSSNQITSELVINEGNIVHPRLQILDTAGARRDDFDPVIVSLDSSVAEIVDSAGSIRGNKAGFSTLSIAAGGAVAAVPATVVKVDAGVAGFAATGIAQDAAQRLYLTSATSDVVLLAANLKQQPQIYAGISGAAGLKDDLRTVSQFNRPTFVALNQADGSLYVSDSANNVVRRVRSGPSGHVESVAGSFNNPQGVALDARGNLWVADSGNHTIRRINLVTGDVGTIAGLAGVTGNADGVGTQARFNSPSGIAVEVESAAQELQRELKGTPPPPVSVIVAESGNGLIRRVRETGQVETIQTASSLLEPGGFQRRSISSPTFNSPSGVAIDPAGNIYVAEPASGRVSVILQTGQIVSAAQSGTFDNPKGIAIAQNGKVLITGSANPARQLIYGQPQIAAVSPMEFSSKGGQQVTVSGSNFAPDTLVVIGGTVISNGTVVNTQTITFTAPSLPSGRSTLTVANRGGASQTVVIIDAVPLSQLPVGYITTVAGGSTYAGEGALATASPMAPGSVAVDANGNAFIVDGLNAKVRRVDGRTGILTTVAGNGTGISSGDNGPAIAAGISAYATVVTFDPGGNLLIGDSGIRRVDARTGLITTIVGGEYGFCGDNGNALNACFDGAVGFAADASGNLFIADRFNHRIRRVDAKTNIVTTFAGNGQAAFSGDNGAATAASLDEPMGVAVDDARKLLYIADAGNSAVRRVDLATGIISTFAGRGANDVGDGGPATAATVFPNALALDAAGNLFISDRGHSRIRKVDISSGIITTYAGSGEIGSGGDGGLATAASLSDPFDIAIDGAGNLLIADFYRYVVRRVDAITQIITTLAGNRQDEIAEDGLPATAATLHLPSGVTLDVAGNIYVASNFRIRRVDAASGKIQTIAGGGHPTDGVGDGGPATSAALQPGGGRVAVDNDGNVYIADRYGYRVRKIQSSGNIITTIAGNGQAQSSGDGGAATAAGVRPDSVAVDQRGNLYIGESDNPDGHFVIRKMNLSTGFITTVAGGGTPPVLGDNGPASRATLGAQFRFVVDAVGNIFISDGRNARVRRVDAVTQIITTIAGSASADNYSDNQPATSVRLSPVAVDIDAEGNVYILDYGYPYAIRRVDPETGFIHTLVTFSGGDDVSNGIGDNGPARSALIGPSDITVDSHYNLFLADTENSRIRAVRGPVEFFDVKANTPIVQMRPRRPQEEH